MYTGIVQACLPIQTVTEQDGLTTFSLQLGGDMGAELETGASVAVNGVCFTVTSITGDLVTFDAIRETLALSNIKYITPGVMVNVERSAKAGVEVGGHVLSGHVVGTASLSNITETPNNKRLTFKAEFPWLKFVFEKGFLAVNGCSLTVAALDRARSEFSINLIPETLERTNFSLLDRGDEVNIEIEAQTQVIVETVERIMSERFDAA